MPWRSIQHMQADHSRMLILHAGCDTSRCWQRVCGHSVWISRKPYSRHSARVQQLWRHFAILQREPKQLGSPAIWGKFNGLTFVLSIVVQDNTLLSCLVLLSCIDERASRHASAEQV